MKKQKTLHTTREKRKLNGEVYRNNLQKIVFLLLCFAVLSFVALLLARSRKQETAQGNRQEHAF